MTAKLWVQDGTLIAKAGTLCLAEECPCIGQCHVCLPGTTPGSIVPVRFSGIKSPTGYSGYEQINDDYDLLQYEDCRWHDTKTITITPPVGDPFEVEVELRFGLFLHGPPEWEPVTVAAAVVIGDYMVDYRVSDLSSMPSGKIDCSDLSGRTIPLFLGDAEIGFDFSDSEAETLP